MLIFVKKDCNFFLKTSEDVHFGNVKIKWKKGIKFVENRIKDKFFTSILWGKKANTLTFTKSVTSASFQKLLSKLRS